MGMHSKSTLYQLIWQTRRLFQKLRSTSDGLLEGTGINASQRAVLEFLLQQHPQTVPEIARDKSVSRQHIQTVVNDLLDLGLIKVVENPAHKRSSLIEISSKGKALFESVKKKEATFIKKLEKQFSQKDLTTALRTLKSLDEHLTSDDWKL